MKIRHTTLSLLTVVLASFSTPGFAAKTPLAGIDVPDRYVAVNPQAALRAERNRNNFVAIYSYIVTASVLPDIIEVKPDLSITGNVIPAVPAPRSWKWDPASFKANQALYRVELVSTLSKGAPSIVYGVIKDASGNIIKLKKASYIKDQVECMRENLGLIYGMVNDSYAARTLFDYCLPIID